MFVKKLSIDLLYRHIWHNYDTWIRYSLSVKVLLFCAIISDRKDEMVSRDAGNIVKMEILTSYPQNGDHFKIRQENNH